MASSSLDGLKFGHKIYLEDNVALGSPAKSSAGGASSSVKKGRGGAVQGAQPPRCQVEGCKVDLSDAKPYYSRHKVCGMHSKSPRVIVAGIEQRFCQQCSRFHQLPEFDQEKRSCRRRLAGHNERRRKPQPSTLLSSPYGRLSSPVFDKSGRVGGFLMEFAAYRKLTLRNAMSNPRSSEQVPGNPWRSNVDTPSDIFLRGSVGGTSYLDHTSPPGESFTGITDTSCALSLLSNQTWGPGHGAPSLGLNNLYCGGTPMTQLAASSPDASWCFKGTEAGNCSHPDLGLDQISQPLANQLPDEFVVPQSDHRRPYMDLLEQSRVYESSQFMHWSL